MIKDAQPYDMLPNPRAQGGIKYLPAERESIIEVGLDEGNSRMSSLRHAQHLQRKVQPNRLAALPQHEAQMGAGATTGVQNALLKSWLKEGHAVAPVEGDQWVRGLVVAFRPEVVPFTHAESGKRFAHTRL